jgi:hypothetical protein
MPTSLARVVFTHSDIRPANIMCLKTSVECHRDRFRGTINVTSGFVQRISALKRRLPVKLVNRDSGQLPGFFVHAECVQGGVLVAQRELAAALGWPR